MKKRIGIVTMMILLCTLISATAFAAKEYVNLVEAGNSRSFEKITVNIDGRNMTGDVPGIVYGSTTMVPVRFITEELGGDVEWIQSKKQVKISVNDKLMYVTQDSRSVVVDGKKMQLPDDVTTPKALSGRIMIPLRFVSEEYGYEVGWDNTKREASVKTDKIGTVPSNGLNKIENITSSIINGKQAITIHNSKDVEYSAYKMADPTRVVVDIKNSEFEGSTDYGISNKLISKVRTGTHDNDLMRIVFDINSSSDSLKYNVIEKSDSLILTFESNNIYKYQVYQGSVNLGEYYELDSAITEAKRWSNSYIVKNGERVWDYNKIYRVYQNYTHLKDFDSESEAVAYAKRWANSRVFLAGSLIWKFEDHISVGKKTIVIDAGHGGSDPGAYSYSKQKKTGGAYEKDLALSVSKYLKQELETRGYIVLMTRSTDVYPTLGDRTRFANSKNADIFVSVHFNAYNTKATGIETWYTSKTSKDYNLAKSIQDELISETKAVNRKVKKGGLYVTRTANMPAALLELGFIDNPNDEAELISDSYHRRTAKATAIGIDKYFKNN